MIIVSKTIYHFSLRFELIFMFFIKLFLGLETNRVH